MKWFLAALLFVGAVLTCWGTAITNGSGSADERVGGTIPVIAGIGFIVLALIIAGAWSLIRA